MKTRIFVLLIICLSAIMALTVKKSNGRNNKPQKKRKHRKAKHHKTRSFLQIEQDTNSAFDDDLATEDSYDSSTGLKKPYRDYNNALENTSDELMKNIKDDLTGEETSYEFDQK
jgi:hypothetical protein